MSLRCAFIRGLWGDQGCARLPKIVRDMALLATRQPQQPLSHVYCYGRENQALLQRCGYQPMVLAEEPVVNWFHDAGSRTGRMMRDQAGQGAWGVSIWRHKLAILHHALTHHADAVVWLDWDCRLVRPLSAGWMEQLHADPPLQAALTQYVYPKCPWRPYDQDLVPCGSWVYCRGLDTAQKLLDWQAAHPEMYDEQAYAAVTDELCGGWTSAAQYRHQGFQPLGVDVHRAVFRPSQEETVFYAPLRNRRRDRF